VRFWSWRRGGNEGRSAKLKNKLKLSEIIMEINDLRELRLRSRSTKTEPLAIFYHSPLVVNPYPEFQRASANAL
jgi:hypothetical protein